MLRSKQFSGAIDGGLFDHVTPLATAVIALLRIALSILVRENRARGFEHGLANEIFRSD